MNHCGTQVIETERFRRAGEEPVGEVCYRIDRP